MSRVSKVLGEANLHLLKDSSEAKTPKLKERVLKDIGAAHKILYNLEIALSNSYEAAGYPHSNSANNKALGRIRDALKKSMDALGQDNYASSLKDLG